jgi:hypothetical protein
MNARFIPVCRWPKGHTLPGVHHDRYTAFNLGSSSEHSSIRLQLWKHRAEQHMRSGIPPFGFWMEEGTSKEVAKSPTGDFMYAMETSLAASEGWR